MRQLRALDLFCGAGGAAVGLHRAGFLEVVGVDIRRQKRYPFQFVQADAMTYPLAGFDLIWASPPCQAFTQIRHLAAAQRDVDREKYPDLIDATRRRLVDSGAVYIIENVIGAPLRPAVKLCGSSFGLKVRRHRLFESNVALLGSDCKHRQQGIPLAVYGHSRGKNSAQRKRPRRRPDGSVTTGRRWYTCPANVAQAREAMGLDYMTWAELTQAVPPAFSEYLGRQAVDFIVATSRAAL